MDSRKALQHGDVTDKVIGAFFDTYNELAGFPEFVLRRAMAIAIRERGLAVEEEKQLPAWFRGHQIVKFRAHYLKATDLEVGLLVNFGRRPEFDRVVCERARKRPRFTPPEGVDRASR
jgi:hypothetical protein